MDIIDKLKYKKGQKALILQPPGEIDFSKIPSDDYIAKDQYNFLLAFARGKKDVDNLALILLEACAPDALIWLAYRKKTSTVEHDFNRDTGWDAFTEAGYRAVAQVSLDTQWSALRFKPFAKVKVTPTSETKTFEAIIQGAKDNSGGTWVDIPFDMEKSYGVKGQVKVMATFDGHPYQGSIANMGKGHMLLVRKDVRKAIGKEAGDSVRVTLQRDKSERKVLIPTELQIVLKKNQRIEDFFHSLSYTNQKEYATWISSAKRPETRVKRLGETLDRLQHGIKNPFIKR